MNNIKRIYIEITNVCNLNCNFCIKNKREYKYMSLIEFRYIINKIKDITKYIYLHVQGEPLLHPNFKEILDICNEYNMYVNLTTNGTLLDKYLDIYKYKCIRKISISMHSFNEDNTNIINNIEILSNTLNDNQYLELRFWNKNNLSNTSIKLINTLNNKYELIDTSKLNSYMIKKNTYIHFDNLFVWPNISNNNNISGNCKGVKNMLCIVSNGDITPCCLDQDCNINIGNIYNDSIDNILNNNRYNNMINNFNNNKIIEQLCKQCTYRNRFN